MVVLPKPPKSAHMEYECAVFPCKAQRFIFEIIRSFAQKTGEHLYNIAPQKLQNTVSTEIWSQGPFNSLPPPETIWKSLENYLRSKFFRGCVNARNIHVL